jgi:hypothetical protein
MARHVSEDRKQAAALQAARRMVSRGDRPLYRLRAGQDGRWTVEGCPWLSVSATGRPEAIDEARAVIAAWLDVPPAAFDLASPSGP